MSIRISFVGYRDINDKNIFYHLPFNTDVGLVKEVIGRVKADGGDDIPEDVQGGLKMALMQDWTEEAIKRIVLITDAPAHGNQYHQLKRDQYPKGNPAGLNLEALM